VAFRPTFSGSLAFARGNVLFLYYKKGNFNSTLVLLNKNDNEGSIN